MCLSGRLWYFQKLKLYLHTFLYDSWVQCDQIAISLFNIWPLKTMVICPNQKSIAKVGSKFCHAVTKPTQDDKRILNCCQSDEISPNLVTMLMLTCVYQETLCQSDLTLTSFRAQDLFTVPDIVKVVYHQTKDDQPSIPYLRDYKWQKD